MHESKKGSSWLLYAAAHWSEHEAGQLMLSRGSALAAVTAMLGTPSPQLVASADVTAGVHERHIASLAASDALAAVSCDCAISTWDARQSRTKVE